MIFKHLKNMNLIIKFNVQLMYILLRLDKVLPKLIIKYNIITINMLNC